MRKESVRHENLKRLMGEFEALGEDTPDETVDMLFLEIKHSTLIAPGMRMEDKFHGFTARLPIGEFGLVFTDMDELRKVFPDYGIESFANPFEVYLEHFERSDYEGYIINVGSECFCLTRNLFESMGNMPEHEFSPDDSYGPEELKNLKDSASNTDLERFTSDPANIGRYEELFEMMSSSTLFTLMVSKEDLSPMFEEGMLSMRKTGPLGYLYTYGFGGEYATVFTSESKMANVEIPLNKYCQIVNFSQMTNYVLNDDMDGIVINPHAENVVLTRDVLLEYSSKIEELCNDSKLNSAIFHAFLIEQEA